MSIETNTAGPSLSKDEKRRLKEEKRARKAAKAAKAAAASGQASGVTSALTTAPASPAPAPNAGAAEGEEVKESKEERKKRKEAKKRKRALENGAEMTSSAPEEHPQKSKKSKKGETVPAAASSATAAPTASTSSIPTTFTPAHNTYLSSNSITLQPAVFPPILSIPSLPVAQPILAYLSRFTNPTPIQACSWPALLAGRDAVAIAETGSGKTLGFGTPGLHLLSTLAPGGAAGSKKKGKKSSGQGRIQILVMAPTRELALQSHETLAELGKGLGIGSVCLYGGVGKDSQLRDLAREDVRIVVGTPGRILDLADSGEMDLASVRYLVLDEADRMLDQGFENDIRRIIAHTPTENRQTVMFSATWPESVRRLASTFLKDPIRITVGSDELSANKRIEQIVEVLDSSRDKDSRMLHHLRTHLRNHPSSAAAPTRILVFALYKKEAQRLESTISRARFSTAGLHGDMGQAERFKALDRFKRGEVNVLVATDVAARGLDIPDVGLVLNVTFPLTTEDFVHRCGRTGRAGKTGKAVTFFTGENHEKSLAGEFMRVLRDVGADIPKEMDRFPSTIKKKEHGSYGAFYKDTTDAPAATKITFD